MNIVCFEELDTYGLDITKELKKIFPGLVGAYIKNCGDSKKEAKKHVKSYYAEQLETFDKNKKISEKCLSFFCDTLLLVFDNKKAIEISSLKTFDIRTLDETDKKMLNLD